RPCVRGGCSWAAATAPSTSSNTATMRSGRTGHSFEGGLVATPVHAPARGDVEALAGAESGCQHALVPVAARLVGLRRRKLGPAKCQERRIGKIERGQALV